MEKEKFTMSDIEVGDEIIFDNTQKIEHNLFWRVVNKISGSRLIVEIREMGFAEKYSIDIRDVININKNSGHFEEAY